MALKKYKCQEIDPIGDFYNNNCIDYCEQYDRLYLNETYTGKDYGECVKKSTSVEPETIGAWGGVATGLTATLMGLFGGETTEVYDEDGVLITEEENNIGTIIVISLVAIFLIVAVFLFLRKR